VLVVDFLIHLVRYILHLTHNKDAIVPQ
jgi:hypothetical protein